MDFRVLIIDDVHPLLTDRLQAAGISCTYIPQSKRAEILGLLPGFDCLVVRSKTPVDRELMDCGTRLKLIARAGSGMDNVDVDCAGSKNITLINVPEANADAVGEHAVGMLLALMNNLLRADREVRNKVWRREANRGVELKGKTVGLIGYGHTGMAVAKKLQGFECHILAWDKYREAYGDVYARQSDMEQIWREADIISLHIPLTDETFCMVDVDYISKFSKPVLLLNLSRGPIVKLDSLADALDAGKVSGCGLDVLENENPENWNAYEAKVFNRLAMSDRVLFTPHIGGWTQESYEKISFFLSNKISYLANRFAEGDFKR